MVFIPFHVVQHEHFSGPWRQTRYGALDLGIQEQPFVASRSRLHCVLVVDVPLLTQPEPLPVLQDDIDRQLVEPRAKSCLTPKRAKLVPGPQEDVLEHVVGFATAEHPPGEAIDPSNVRPVQPFEGRRISLLRQRHIPGVGVGFSLGSQW